MKNVLSTITAVVGIISVFMLGFVVILSFALLPALIILWALNLLFALAIPITIWTVIATAILLGLLTSIFLGRK